MTPELQRLRDAPPPPIDRVRRRVARRRARRRLAAAGGALAVLVGVGLFGVRLFGASGIGGLAGGEPGDGARTRDRGIGAVPLVALDAVAEGPDGPRPLADGAAVTPDERVVFFVRSSAPGYASIREQGAAAVYPPSGAWRIEAGESVPGGASPQSWRPDGALGPLRYELVVCPDPEPSPACASSTLTLSWTP